jgi:integrase
MALLLDHGLRVGEVAGLMVADFDLAAGELRFCRPKVDKEQRHRLSRDTLRAAVAYFKHDSPLIGVLLGSRKGGELTTKPMSARAITKRVAYLGKRLGIERLSAHDCRHYWASDAAENDTDLLALMDAGGWTSPAMPARYVEAAKIANERVKLSEG